MKIKPVFRSSAHHLLTKIRKKDLDENAVITRFCLFLRGKSICQKTHGRLNYI